MKFQFTEASGLADSIYGKCQTPIKMFLEQRGEAMEKASLLKEVFTMNTSNNFGDTYTGMTAMEGFKPVGESGPYPTDGMQEGYKKTILYHTWKDSFSISKEMIEDAKLMDMKKKPQNFLTGYHRTREKFGAALYGAAIQGKKETNFKGVNFDTTCNDGLPLFDKAHTSILDKKFKQSNMFSDAFSAKALGALETRMQNFRGDANELLDVAPTTILIPNDADLKDEVFAAIGADKNPVNSNNAFNYQYGRWRVLVWNYLNDYVADGKKPWILLDQDYNEKYSGAVWTDRIQLEMSSKIDDNTDSNVWRGRSRYNAGFVDWRYVAIGGVDGGDTLIA